MPRRSDPEYGETLDELMKDPKDQDPRGFEKLRRGSDDPKPGSDAYIRRRDREGAEDLRRMPPRGK